MISIAIINELTLRLLGVIAAGLLRALGGPNNLPQSNLDFVWY